MSASLVGSEMCIRDRLAAPRHGLRPASKAPRPRDVEEEGPLARLVELDPCLLYTSDAADDM
eukprot:2719531-Alexandrium_andersonii.AAC.1